jgi:hypothetical protein
MLPRSLRLAVVLALLAPAAARADSITHLRDGDIWVAEPDGSAARAVTTGGGYGSPSQSDSGVIAAAKGDQVVLLDRRGARLAAFDPPPATDWRGGTVDGEVTDVAISPDAARVAYAFERVDEEDCPSYDPCVGGGVITVATGAVSDHHRFHAPSWATAGRLLLFGPYDSATQYKDLGAEPVHWFEDHDVFPGYGAGLVDGELSPSGERIALVRGGGESKAMHWYRTPGDPLDGVPGKPEAECATNLDGGIHRPGWSPDGTALTMAATDGVYVIRDVGADCATATFGLLFPGASEPDWGPAPATLPEPVTVPAPPVPRPAPQVAPPPALPAQAVTITAAPKLKGRTIKVAIALARPSGFIAELRLAAKEARKRKLPARLARKQGTDGGTIAFALSRKRAKALKRARTLTVTVTAGTASQTVAVRTR